MLPPNYPSDSTQKKIVCAFRKFGFITRSGRSGHIIVCDPKSGVEFPIQSHIYKQVIKCYLKRVDQLGYDIDKFISYL
jgi:hypothetical protein